LFTPSSASNALCNVHHHLRHSCESFPSYQPV
jgi:hypothetical protein